MPTRLQLVFFIKLQLSVLLLFELVGYLSKGIHPDFEPKIIRFGGDYTQIEFLQIEVRGQISRVFSKRSWLIP